MAVDPARVLIAHDYVTQRGGAERVTLSLLKAFPGAALLTSIYDPASTYPEFADHEVRTLWVDRIPAFKKDPRRAMPFLARAFSTAQVGDVDAVVCSSSGWAHGLRTTVPKLVYCHTPARWLYETDDYLPGVPGPVRAPARTLLPLLKRWDARAAATVTTYFANSSVVRERIRRAYDVPSTLLHPPVTLDVDAVQEPVPGVEDGYLLVVSRQRGYKHVEAICEAVEQSPGERLVFVGGLPAKPGGGTWSSRLQGVSRLTDGQMRWIYAHAAALVAVSHEDFGLTPIEAYSFGTPAVLLRAGGYLDSSIEDVTCVFVDSPSEPAIRDALRRFRAQRFDPAVLRAHGARFNEAAFQSTLRAAVEDAVAGASAPAAGVRSNGAAA